MTKLFFFENALAAAENCPNSGFSASLGGQLSAPRALWPPLRSCAFFLSNAFPWSKTEANGKHEKGARQRKIAPMRWTYVRDCNRVPVQPRGFFAKFAGAAKGEPSHVRDGLRARGLRVLQKARRRLQNAPEGSPKAPEGTSKAQEFFSAFLASYGAPQKRGALCLGSWELARGPRRTEGTSKAPECSRRHSKGIRRHSKGTRMLQKALLQDSPIREQEHFVGCARNSGRKSNRS
jgi:hypothetical protein